jgi:hypothetical protein
MTANPSATPSDPDLEPAVIDLTDGPSGRVTVKFPHRTDPFSTMSQAERKRLLVRVLCELVAYGEDVEDDGRRSAERSGPGIRIPAYTRDTTPSQMAMTPF